MKKTVSVNIKGINFLIEEDAYELLQDYLDRLKKKLATEPGGSDIVEDIEIRIAELCSTRLKDNKTVIELADIQEIIAKLGDPEDYVEPDEDAEQDNTQSANNMHKGEEKRLFRDTENATLGGVCAGIANFLNVDVVIIRAIFVIMFLFAGFGFPLYMILWIIIPKAKNTIDRLRMKGKPITVETVKQEVENAAENISRSGKRFAHAIRNEEHYSRSISRGARLLSSILGVGLILIGITLLIPFLIFTIGGFDFIPVQSDEGLVSFPEFGSLVLANDGDYALMKLGVLMGGFSAILFLFLLGSMLILRIKNRWSKMSLFGLFLTGLTGFILCAIISVRTGKDFVVGGEVEQTIGTSQTKELHIFPRANETMSRHGLKVKSNDNYGFIEFDEEDITLYGIHFEYVPSQDSSFHIYQQLSSRGVSHRTAVARSENIMHDVDLMNDSLFVDTYYKFPKDDKLRDQEVTVIVEIPHEGAVRFDDRIIKLGAENETDRTKRFYNEDGYLKSDGRYRHDD